MRENILEAKKIIDTSKYVVAITGAGISVDSGVPTFQGTDGLWTRFGKPSLNSYSDFIKDPDKWWLKEIKYTSSPYINELRKTLELAKPNIGHKILKLMEDMDLIKMLITQNIDGLHQDLGTNNLIEIHGNRNKFRCISCNWRKNREEKKITRIPDPCMRCGKIMKFDSVMFGEPIPKDVLKSSRDSIDYADCVLSIGTSSTVRPAAGLFWIAKSQNAKLIEINISPTKLTNYCDVVINGSTSEILPELFEILNN